MTYQKTAPKYQYRLKVYCMNVLQQDKFLWRGVVSTSPNPQAEGPPPVDSPWLLIQYIHSYPPYWRLFLHPHPEDKPCHGDRDPFIIGDKIEKNKMGRACSAYGERRGIYRVLLGKPEGNGPLGRPRSRWEDNIKMDLEEVSCGGMNWIELAQVRDRWRALVNAVMNIQVQ